MDFDIQKTRYRNAHNEIYFLEIDSLIDSPNIFNIVVEKYVNDS